MRTQTRLLLCMSLLALTGGIASSTFATDEWKEASIPLVGVENYFAERCIEFDAGEKIVYRYKSPHPLNFNIHYHPQQGIEYKIQKEKISEFTGEFTSVAKQEYCFTWTNPTDLGGKEWALQLQYRVAHE